jgi:uncharacterized protein
MSSLFEIETDRVTLTWRTRGSAETSALHGLNPPPGLLRLTSRRRGLQFRKVHRMNVPAPLSGDLMFSSGPHLFEQRDYRVLLRSHSEAPVALVHRDPNITRDVDSGATASGVVNFRSSVGRSTFSVLVDGIPEFDFEVEVFPTKLDYATDYQELLAEVREVLTTLALEYLQTTERVGGHQQTSNASTLDWITILRHVISDLESSLRQIARQPLRAVTREPIPTPVHRVTRVDSAVRRQLLKPPNARSMRLAAGRLVPSVISERKPQITLDTPEHRWLASQLERIRRRLAAIRAAEAQRQDSLRARKVLAELQAMEERVSVLERLEPIRSATRSNVPAYASLALLKTNGYREAYSQCILLGLALHLDGEALRLPVKELSLLYEYWCFLKVAIQLSQSTRQPIDPRSLLKIERAGIRVTLRKGVPQTLAFDAGSGRSVSVTYNREYGGILLTQKPDFVVSLKEGQWPRVDLILDAKYRLDASESYVDKYDCPGPPEDALNVLHRYRDAILFESSPQGPSPWSRSVVQAAALYPYRESRDGEYENSRIWRSLDAIGIGAIPLLPQFDRYLQRWLDEVLKEGGWRIAERAIPHVSQTQLWTWRRAASEPVLIGVLRNTAPREHLDWIRTQRTYYTPLTGQRRLPATREVGIYEPAGPGVRGVIRSHAEVEGFEILERGQIKTPWPSRRNAGELQMLFHLSDFQDDLSVENIRSERFSTNRWTSRLALMRAQSLAELLLETEPEWRLYETLIANNIAFSIEAGHPTLHDENTVRGRAWFVAGESRAQYRGATGFVVRSRTGDEHYSPSIDQATCRLRASGIGSK